ncbi:hypothetical protein K438DRAFT_1977356 [Mycena galopus ATCC 62051]|nr:hypothetical protein K438DRAFT_1977356 [Mycena galopus ATCC 62051]
MARVGIILFGANLSPTTSWMLQFAEQGRYEVVEDTTGITSGWKCCAQVYLVIKRPTHWPHLTLVPLRFRGDSALGRSQNPSLKVHRRSLATLFHRLPCHRPAGYIPRSYNATGGCGHNPEFVSRSSHPDPGRNACADTLHYSTSHRCILGLDTTATRHSLLPSSNGHPRRRYLDLDLASPTLPAIYSMPSSHAPLTPPSLHRLAGEASLTACNVGAASKVFCSESPSSSGASIPLLQLVWKLPHRCHSVVIDAFPAPRMPLLPPEHPDTACSLRVPPAVWRRRRPHFCGYEQRFSKSISNRGGAAYKTKGSGDWSIGMGRSGKMRSHLRPLYGKTSLFQKARRYLLDDEANPDRSSQET